MPKTEVSLETRVEELSRQVEYLTQEFTRLAEKVKGIPTTATLMIPQAVPESEETARVVSSQNDQNITTVLSTIATVSFLLAIALVLRTVVDNGTIDRQVGSYLGMIYAAMLLAHSFWRYSHGHPHFPVYSTCGALLIFSIVYESQSKFDTLSAPVAYALLGATLVAMCVLGLRYSIPTAVMVGTIGACGVGLALEFPNPYFACLAALLLLGSLVSQFARKLHECGWLRWGVLLITLLFWVLWTTKVRAEISRGRTPPPQMDLTWMFFCLAAFMAFYVGAVIRAVLRPHSVFGFFERILPLVGVLLGFLVAIRVSSAGWGNEETIGWVCVVVSAFHMALAFWAAKYERVGALAATSFVVAGLTLLALALPVTSLNRIAVLWVWSGVAFGIGLVASRSGNRPIGLIAIVFQGIVCGASVLLGWLAVETPVHWFKLISVAGIGLVCFFHYLLSGAGKDSKEGGVWGSSQVWNRFRTGVFFVSLVYAFAAARIVLYSTLPGSGSSFDAAFLSGQSVLINVAALLLLFWGVRRKDSEILTTAFILAAIGALKVFGYDFMQTQGLPLVTSVLSFGITAGLGSLVWRRR